MGGAADLPSAYRRLEQEIMSDTDGVTVNISFQETNDRRLLLSVLLILWTLRCRNMMSDGEDPESGSTVCACT